MNKGYSLIEMLISVVILSIVTLSIADFSSNMFKVSFEHSSFLADINQSRDLSSVLSTEIAKAEYIFPPNNQIYLSTSTGTIKINTDNSVAFLVLEDDGTYLLEAFYIDANKDLYLFKANDGRAWQSNTLPSSSFSYAAGIKGVVFSNVSSLAGALSYILNNENGSTDSILKGAISGSDETNQYALIKGINWEINFDNKNYKIGGISYNVPRFVSN